MITLRLPLLYADTGRLARDADAAEVAQCIQSILGTAPEELEANPAFGSRVPLLILHPNDAALERELLEEAGAAIGRWERRAMYRGGSVTVPPGSPRATRVEVRFALRAAPRQVYTTGVDFGGGT
mgnify:FL=1